MKKTLLALAVLSAFTGVASAQSSVTLSGGVDAGIRRQGTAAGNDWSLGGSTSSNNAVTLSGVEDLGGGMRAFFNLNHRFNIGTGANNSPTNAPAGPDPFWRLAWVGLGGGFGDLRLGRITMPLNEVNGGYEPWGVATVASVNAGGVAATVRANNAMYYRSPSLGGLSVHLGIAASEGQLVNGETGGSTPKFFAPTARANNERPVGGAIIYAAGPLSVSLAFDKNTADMKTAGLYGSFDMGAAKLFAQFEKGDNFTSGTATALAEKIKAVSFGVTAPVGAFVAKAGYLRISSDLPNVSTATVSRGDGAKVGLGADYILSKRTKIYTDVAKWSGTRFDVATKKARFDIGVAHKF